MTFRDLTRSVMMSGGLCLMTSGAACQVLSCTSNKTADLSRKRFLLSFLVLSFLVRCANFFFLSSWNCFQRFHLRSFFSFILYIFLFYIFFFPISFQIVWQFFFFFVVSGCFIFLKKKKKTYCLTFINYFVFIFSLCLTQCFV